MHVSSRDDRGHDHWWSWIVRADKPDATKNAARWRRSFYRGLGIENKGRNKMQNNLKRFASTVAFFGATFGWSLPSYAGVDKIVVDQTLQVMFAPIPLNSSVNTNPIPYTVYQGR